MPYTDVLDNKPPLLMLLIATIEAAGPFALGYATLASVGIGSLVALTVVLTRRVGPEHAAITAGLLVLVLAWQLGLLTNAIRGVAAAGGLLGVVFALDEQVWAAGIAIAAAGLIVQFAWLALLPALAATSNRGRLLRQTGLAVIIPLLFATVLWGSAVIHWSVVVPIAYALPVDLGLTGPALLLEGTGRSLWGQPAEWFWYMGRWTVPLVVTLIGLRGARSSTVITVGIATFVAVLTVRSHAVYWLYVLPFVAVGAVAWLDRQLAAVLPTHPEVSHAAD
jgi:hypothetical protein